MFIGTYVISFELEMGRERYFVVGCYIPPSDVDSQTLAVVVATLEQRPKGCLPMIICNLNVDLESPWNMKEAKVANVVDNLGIGCLTRHFLQRRTRHIKGKWTLRQQ